jgi:hypothetical protein
MSRTIKAKRYNTLAACIRRSIWNDIAYPLAVDRRFGKTPMQTFLSSWVARIECTDKDGASKSFAGAGSSSARSHCRRLMACYDALAMVAVRFAKLAMISLMLKRLTSA